MEKYYEKVKELGDYLTNHPEISGEEIKSCAYITGFLEKQGYEVEREYAGMPNAFRAVDRERREYAGKKAAFLVSAK